MMKTDLNKEVYDFLKEWNADQGCEASELNFFLTLTKEGVIIFKGFLAARTECNEFLIIISIGNKYIQFILPETNHKITNMPYDMFNAGYKFDWKTVRFVKPIKLACGVIKFTAIN